MDIIDLKSMGNETFIDVRRQIFQWVVVIVSTCSQSPDFSHKLSEEKIWLKIQFTYRFNGKVQQFFASHLIHISYLANASNSIDWRGVHKTLKIIYRKWLFNFCCSYCCLINSQLSGNDRWERGRMKTQNEMWNENVELNCACSSV